MGGLAAYVAKRLAGIFLTILGVITILFILLHSIPGDPARVIAGLMASEEDVERIRRQLGLDKPLHVQYVTYLYRLLTLDLGVSARTQAPVIDEVMARLPNTVLLAVVSMAISVAVGVPLGILAAIKRNTAVDVVITGAGLVGVSMPVYWTGLMLISVFAVNLKLLPAGGYGTWKHLILPSLTLSLYLIAFIMRMTKSSVLEVLNQDYVKMAVSKGLKRRQVLFKHVLRNALIPVVTITGLQFGNLLGGAVLTETIFAWPGMGRLIVDSIFARDYPVVQGAIFVFALLFALVNLIVDLIYTVIDPRIRLTGERA